MSKRLFPSLALATIAALSMPVSAIQEMKATVARDETNEFSCAARKRVAVLVEAQKDTLPEQRYQYSVGGNLHVLCADHAGSPPPPGRKVRISLRDDAVLLIP